MLRTLPLTLLTITCLSGLIGCATAGDARVPNATVTLREDGRIYVDETYTGLSKMVAQLTKLGCSAATRITIEIPGSTSANAMTQISRELRTAGFIRFVFVKPRKAVVEVGEDPLIRRFKEAKGITNGPPPKRK